MKAILSVRSYLKALGRTALSFLPTPLPNSPQTLDVWLGEVLELSGYPDNPSFRNALATEIMHLPTRSVSKSKAYFVRSIRAAVIRQQVFASIERAKDEAKAARQAEADKTGQDVASSPKTPLVE